MIQLFLGNTSFGPGKVFANLTKGLQSLKVDYNVNAPYINVNFPAYCLSPHPFLFSDPNLLSIGPNICVLPTDLPVVTEQKFKYFITPCDWTADLYSRWIERDKGKSKFKLWNWIPFYLKWFFYGFATTFLFKRKVVLKDEC